MAKPESIASFLGGLSGKAIAAKKKRKKELDKLAKETRTTITPPKKQKSKK